MSDTRPFVVRRCLRADDAGWLALRQALWPAPADEHLPEMRSMLDDPSRDAILIARLTAAEGAETGDGQDGGEPIGLAEVSLRFDYVNGAEHRPAAHLEGLYVAPARRRRGVARALVQAGADWATALGVREMTSDALLDNRTSLEAHRRLGFEPTDAVQYFVRRLPPTPPRPAAVSLPEGAQVRVLGMADAASFQALRLRALLEAPTAFASSWAEEQGEPVERVASRLTATARGAVLGLFLGDTLVGVAGVQREGLVKLAHKAFVWGVYVAPEARRRGLAAALLQAALRHAADVLGAHRVTLGVHVDNRAACALYQRLGFVVYGRERDFLRHEGRSHDELLMAIDLSNV